MALRARKRQGGSPTRRATTFSPENNIRVNPPPKPPVKGLGPPKGLQVPPIGSPANPTGAITSPRAAATYQPAGQGVVPIVPVRGPTSEAMRANAQSALTRAQTANRDAIFRAVMSLGDPGQFAKYQNDPNFTGYQFTQDPNSVWATLARQEGEGLEGIDNSTIGGNTFFSGMRTRDRGRFSDDVSRQRLGATTSFSDDLKAIASAFGLSQDEFRQAMADADQMDIENTLAQERFNRDDPVVAAPPATAGPVPGSPSGSSTNPYEAYLRSQAAAGASHQTAVNKAKTKKAKKK